MTNFRMDSKTVRTRPLVKMSAFCSVVEIFMILMCPFATWERKKWYLTAMCLDRGVMRGEEARMRAPLLSSKTLE